MNCRKTNVLFLFLIVGHYLLIAGILLFYYMNPDKGEISIITNLLLSQMSLALPALLVVTVTKKNVSLKQLAGFSRVKRSTVFMTVLYAFLLMPLTSLLNAISMLFVDNVVLDMTGDILDVPFLITFSLIAVLGPFCEELVFRGFVFRGYRTSGNIFGAVILSAVLFGLMHLNLNQAPYAIALGIGMALLAEATGSTTAPFIMHMVFNGQSVCLMYIEKYLFPEIIEAQAEGLEYADGEMLMMIAMFTVLAMIGTAIAMCVLARIAQNEGKNNFFRTIWLSRKWKLQRLVDWVIVLAIALCIMFIAIETMFLVG